MSGIAEEMQKREATGFYSRRRNINIQIKSARSETSDPAAAFHPEAKFAKFQEGVYWTDDPEIIQALDKRDDVYRLDDPRVAAFEEVAGMEPEDQASHLRLLDKAAPGMEFAPTRPSVAPPGAAPIPPPPPLPEEVSPPKEDPLKVLVVGGEETTEE